MRKVDDADVLHLYRDRYAETGVSPTQREIAEMLGVSEWTVNVAVARLVEAGVLRSLGRRGHIPV